jgi:DNA (cytosine-5)-methyltransferase 1
LANIISRKQANTIASDSPVCAVDLFCGAGGLTYGLRKAGIDVVAGIDLDEQVAHAYQHNNPGAEFYGWDVDRKQCRSIEKLFTRGKLRLLAGCAPCQPFSKLTQAVKDHQAWDLLDNFGRFIEGILPELVTMENVPELAGRGREVFDRFLATLEKFEYKVDWQIVECPKYGVPQSRRRLVLLASRLGKIAVPQGSYPYPSQWKSVKATIGRLPKLEAGEEAADDRLHAAAVLSRLNLRRIRATPHDGGNWGSWPKHLVLACHRKQSGQTYHSIYGRMWWDRPAPTMTTLCTGIGNGRFGHPDQDRSITLREASLFQSFPKNYEFWPADQKVNRKAVGRMIGNAVPPKLAETLGEAIMSHVRAFGSNGKIRK